MKIIITESQLRVLRRINVIDREADSYYENLQSLPSLGITSEMFCKLYPMRALLEEIYYLVYESEEFKSLEFTDEEENFIKKYIKKKYGPKLTKFYKSHCDQFKK